MKQSVNAHQKPDEQIEAIERLVRTTVLVAFVGGPAIGWGLAWTQIRLGWTGDHHGAKTTPHTVPPRRYSLPLAVFQFAEDAFVATRPAWRRACVINGRHLATQSARIV